MVVFGLVLSLTGIQSSSMTGLLIMALLLVWWIDRFADDVEMDGAEIRGWEVIEQPRNKRNAG